jgi:hypothetical protein
LTGSILLDSFQQAKIALVGPDEPQHYKAHTIEKLLASYLKSPTVSHERS